MASRGQSRSLCSYNCSTLSFPKVSHSSFIRVIQSVKPKSFFRYYYPRSPAPNGCFLFLSQYLWFCRGYTWHRGFTVNNLPVQVPNQTKVRIFAGLGLNSTSGTGGNCPTVALWDGSGGFIGSSGPVVDSIGSGDFVDLDVQPPSATNDRATEYMAVAAAGSDDICIASIALTMPSGDNLVMYGDVPSQCGAPWYHSNEILGNLDFKPRCVWITNTVSKTRPYQGFGIHLPDFVFTEARLAQYNLHDGSMCHAQPRFSMYTQIGMIDSIPVFDPPINTNPGNLTDPDPGAVSTAPMTPADPITGLTNRQTHTQWH